MTPVLQTSEQAESSDPFSPSPEHTPMVRVPDQRMSTGKLFSLAPFTPRTKGILGDLVDKRQGLLTATSMVTRSMYNEARTDPTKTPSTAVTITGSDESERLDLDSRPHDSFNPDARESLLTNEQHSSSPNGSPTIPLNEKINLHEVSVPDSLIVTCFHESKGTTSSWPIEVESIRRTIKSKLDEILLPEIVGGDFAYWQWDLWVFCAGYKSDFVQAGDIRLLETGADKDSRALQFKSGTNTNYSRISNVAGSEIRGNTLRREATMTDVEVDDAQELPPLEVEEILGDREGTFRTNSLLNQPSALLDESSREAQVRQSARILISIRKRSDHPVNSAEQPIMVFGPAIGPYHPLKRGDGSGVQTVSIDEIESYGDADLDFLIGIEYRKTNGSVVILKYLTKSRHMSALAKKVGEKCKDMARTLPGLM